jgi:APA family basic amino acid/polyamine antiporter
VGEAIGFSSFTVLTYYAITNASALTLSRHERRWPRPVAALGLAGCVLVAASLPATTVLSGLAVLALGLLASGISRVLRRRT